MLDKTALIRIVLTDGNLRIDETGKANGRGAYLCKNANCLEMARKQKGLERSLKCAIPQEIYASLKIE